MQALLDTHVLLWWLADDPALTRTARKVIADTKNTLVVSAASAWEISTKVRLGRLPSATHLVADFPGQIAHEGFELQRNMLFELACYQGRTKTRSTVC